MKLLSQLDSAANIKQDANNRFVTDAEKTAWNGKQNALGYTPVDKAGDSMTGDLKVNGDIVAAKELVVGYNGTTESLQRHKWKYNGSTGYLELWRYSRQNKWELSATFPNRSTGEGGLVVEGKQMATEDYVNGKVKTDVPVGAKFTDTTYTEISESEINTGTASTLRTITARRIKFILDKVQGWISNLTKVDVGLGDVDNVQQATKTEFNAHNNDNTRHITTNERTAWNNKWDYNETTIENVKVNKAVDADTVNGKTVAVNVPSGAKFTDTITTINSKTGAITKADIVALGIPAQDTVYTHPTSHPASMITESSTKRFVSDAEKTAWNGKQNALGYTPVNKAGDTMGRLEVTGSTTSSPGLTITGQRANLLFNTTGATGGVAFRVVQADITNTDNNTSTVASIGGYGGANLGGSPTSNYMYLDARTDGTWNNATLKIDSQNRVGIAIASSGRPTQALDVNGKIRMRTQTQATDADDTVATKKYVDDVVAASGVETGSTLPAPDATWYTKLFILIGGTGVADHLYVCLKKADGTYWWCNATGLN